MPEKRLLEEVLLTAYFELVPDSSSHARYLMRRLAAALYERGARISLGEVIPPAYHDVHHSLDLELRLVWVSKEWGQLMGYRPHQAVGLHASEWMTGDTLRFLQEVGLPELIRGEKVGPVTVTYVTRAGEILPGTVRSERMLDEAGRFLRTFARTKLREPLLRPSEGLHLRSAGDDDGPTGRLERHVRDDLVS